MAAIFGGWRAVKDFLLVKKMTDLKFFKVQAWKRKGFGWDPNLAPEKSLGEGHPERRGGLR